MRGPFAEPSPTSAERIALIRTSEPNRFADQRQALPHPRPLTGNDKRMPTARTGETREPPARMSTPQATCARPSFSTQSAASGIGGHSPLKYRRRHERCWLKLESTIDAPGSSSESRIADQGVLTHSEKRGAIRHGGQCR